MLWILNPIFSNDISWTVDISYLVGLLLLCMGAWDIRKHDLNCAQKIAAAWVIVIISFSYKFLVIVSVFRPDTSLEVATVALTRCVLHTLLLPALLTVGIFMVLNLVSLRSTSFSSRRISLWIMGSLGVLLISAWGMWVMYTLWKWYGWYPAGKAYFP